MYIIVEFLPETDFKEVCTRNIGNYHCFNGEKSTRLVLLCIFIIEEVHNISQPDKFPVLDKTIQGNYIQIQM